MPGLSATAGPRLVLVCLLLVVVVLSPVGSAYAACSAGSCGSIDVAPGKYAQKLGADFPTFGTVKMTYPNSSILTSSIGDLLFTMNLTQVGYYRTIDIYIPPDFTGLTISKVWSSFSNDYNPNSISLSRLGTNDRIGPNWWKVSVQNLSLNIGPTVVADRNFTVSENQYVRIFQVTSPSIAGRYFFKTFINGTSTGAGNFPTVVVKASRDPAYISGMLKDARNATTQLEQPISIPDGTGARIVATGTDYLGRSVSAQTFINSTAKGQYTLFGLAPGTYNLTAYAAGYLPTTRQTSVSVLAAQSLVGVDIYLKHSVNVTGTVLSVSSAGLPVPWKAANRSAVRVEVLTLNGAVAASYPPTFSPFQKITNTSTTFPFSIQWQLGLDGRIPQDYANYTTGLVSGDYRLRASVNSYVQYDDSLIHVGNETNLVRSEVRLTRIGSFFVTVHFKDFNSTLGEVPVSNSGSLSVQAYGLGGNVGGRGTARVQAKNTTATVEIPCPPGTYHIFASFTASQNADQFFQMEDVQASIGLGDVHLSLAMLRGGRMNLTLYSVDAEKPAVLKHWTFPKSDINLKAVDSYGNVYSFKATQGTNTGYVNVTYAGLLTDNYSIIVQTFGYTQREIIRLHVIQGGTSDASVWLVQDPRIDLTIIFKTEGLLSAIDSTLPYAQPINNLDSTPVRIEIFDAYGNFVGANRTYVGNHNSSIKVTLAGFRAYFGNPRLTWSGFYDTTDATRQDEGGLQPGDYLIRIWVDGYYQFQLIPVTLPSRGNVSIIYSMERASRVSGTVLGPDLNYRARLLSWAVIDLEPGTYTTFSLDGNYSLWVPGGSYNMGVSLPGYSTYTAQFEVPKGSDIKADIWLDNPQSSSSNLASTLQTIGIWLILTPFTCFALSLRERRFL